MNIDQSATLQLQPLQIYFYVIEEKIFSTCPKEFLPLKYARYLDDTFAVFQNKQANYFFLIY